MPVPKGKGKQKRRPVNPLLSSGKGKKVAKGGRKPRTKGPDYSKYTVTELRGMCREKGVTGFSTLRKADLVKFVEKKCVPTYQDRKLQDSRTLKGICGGRTPEECIKYVQMLLPEVFPMLKMRSTDVIGKVVGKGGDVVGVVTADGKYVKISGKLHTRSILSVPKVVTQSKVDNDILLDQIQRTRRTLKSTTVKERVRKQGPLFQKYAFPEEFLRGVKGSAIEFLGREIERKQRMGMEAKGGPLEKILKGVSYRETIERESQKQKKKTRNIRAREKTEWRKLINKRREYCAIFNRAFDIERMQCVACKPPTPVFSRKLMRCIPADEPGLVVGLLSQIFK